MTVLVTGATGLIGTRLLPRLVETGQRPCRALVRGAKSVCEGVEVIDGDLFDSGPLARALDGVSAVIHLAAVFRTHDEALIWKSNRDGTADLVAATRRLAPHARFILASTSNVYAKDQARPGRETDPVDPPKAYPASKVAAERILRDSGLTWAVLRFPFVYGDGDGHLAALPAHAMSAGWHPAMRMSTIHHRDIATAMMLALDGVMDGRIVNIADDLPASMLDLVALGGGELPRSSEPLAAPWAMQVDTSLACGLGFRPAVRTVHQAAQENLL